MQNYQSTADLITGIKNQHQDSMSKFCDDYSPSLYAYILKIVIEEGQADKILKSVLLKAWQTIYTYDQNQNSFFVWALNIARNEAVDSLCQSEAILKLMKSDQISDVNPLAPASITDDRLSLLEKTIIALKNCRHWNETEIARFLSLPPGFIERKMHEAFKKIEPQELPRGPIKKRIE